MHVGLTVFQMGTSVAPTRVLMERVWTCTKPSPAAVTKDMRANTVISVSLFNNFNISAFDQLLSTELNRVEVLLAEVNNSCHNACEVSDSSLCQSRPAASISHYFLK